MAPRTAGYGQADLGRRALGHEGSAGGPEGGARCPDFMPRGRARAYPRAKAVGRHRWRLAAGRRKTPRESRLRGGLPGWRFGVLGSQPRLRADDPR